MQTAVPSLRDFLLLYGESQLAQFLVASGHEAANLSFLSSVVAYYDVPRITIYSEQYDSTNQGINFAIDLNRETMRVIPGPGQSIVVSLVFSFGMGVFDNALEEGFIPAPSGSEMIGTNSIFLQAMAQGIPFVVISTQNEAILSTLAISANAKAYITTAIDNGLIVIVPSQELTIGNTPAVSWFQLNPITGEMSGVLENGIHSVEYTAGQTVVEDGAGYVIASEAVEIEDGLVLEKEAEAQIVAIEKAEAALVKAEGLSKADAKLIFAYLAAISGVVGGITAALGQTGAGLGLGIFAALAGLASVQFDWGNQQ